MVPLELQLNGKLIAKNIKFTTCFGGGTIYSAGEDSMFIWDMLKKE